MLSLENFDLQCHNQELNDIDLKLRLDDGLGQIEYQLSIENRTGDKLEE